MAYSIDGIQYVVETMSWSPCAMFAAILFQIGVNCSCECVVSRCWVCGSILEYHVT